MNKYKYTNAEQRFNNILNYQSKELDQIAQKVKQLDIPLVEQQIAEAEDILRTLGYSKDIERAKNVRTPVAQHTLIVPSWEELCSEAEAAVGNNCSLEALFTPEELQSNEVAIRQLNQEFNELHKLDSIDVTISAVAGLVGAAVEILMIGIPQKGTSGLEAGLLSNYIRARFDKVFPANEMEKLANSKVSKVPFDAQDNRHTTEYINGLSAYYHRLLTLGHDPLLGFVVGVFDILTGRMTTIDKTGKIVSQVMENYADRKEHNIFAALAKQIIHLKSDITTSMGLPAPLMGLFNLIQFGSIGEEDQTIAEIVQGMYYEGYDFIHFCSLSIPVMLVEVIVRVGYALKRIKEGHSIKDSIPFSLNRNKNPKLSTMLFVGHSAATAVNAGKVCFTKNPMYINFPQWIAFAKYSYKQLKWCILEKSELRDEYVRGKLDTELKNVYQSIDNYFEEFSKTYSVIMS